MEKAMATHSSTRAWKIPWTWTEEPGRLWSMGWRRVGHNWATSLSLFTSMHWRRKWQPTPVFLPGESQGRRSLVAAVYGVAQSWTRLTWLSSSNIREIRTGLVKEWWEITRGSTWKGGMGNTKVSWYQLERVFCDVLWDLDFTLGKFFGQNGF